MTHQWTWKLLLLALPVLALDSTSRAAAVDFDGGVDASSALKQAREAEPAKVPGAAAVGASRYDVDCVDFTFQPGDPALSPAVTLRSQEWVQECRPTGDPRNGGGVQCWDRPGFSYTQKAQIELKDRKPLLPWESDTFRVCLQGPWIRPEALATAYKYRLSSGESKTRLVYVAGEKTPMKPDPAGLAAQSLSPALALTIADKWASYYSGEKTVLKLTLKKEVPNWFDPTVAEIEIAAAAAASYQVNLRDYASRFSSALERGKRYYVKLSFKRLGTVSTGDLAEAGDSAHVAYEPAASAVGR